MYLNLCNQQIVVEVLMHLQDHLLVSHVHQGIIAQYNLQHQYNVQMGFTALQEPLSVKFVLLVIFV